ncbi:MAG: hypothetical protein ACLRU3_01875 [Paraclostridium sp.]
MKRPITPDPIITEDCISNNGSVNTFKEVNNNAPEKTIIKDFNPPNEDPIIKIKNKI